MHQLGTKAFSPARLKALFGTLGAVAVIGVLSTAPAYADVVFTLGNNPQPNEENVLFTSGESGSTITGTTNKSGTVVDFSSTTDVLLSTASGQANVAASDGAINDISISIPGTTFADLIVNPEHGSGTADVTVVATDGTFSFSYSIGNGNNFLTITTTGGETITSATIDDSSGFRDLKQPRISGIAGVSTVPEPSAFIMWLVPFLGMAGLAGRKLLAV